MYYCTENVHEYCMLMFFLYFLPTKDDKNLHSELITDSINWTTIKILSLQKHIVDFMLHSACILTTKARIILQTLSGEFLYSDHSQCWGTGSSYFICKDPAIWFEM